MIVFTLRVIRLIAAVARILLARGSSLAAKVEAALEHRIRGMGRSLSMKGQTPVEEVVCAAIPEIVPVFPALPAINRPAKVTLLIPSLDKSAFYGGVATALIVTAKLAARLGMPVRIAQTTRRGHSSDLGQFFSRFGIPFTDSDVEVLDLSSRRHDRNASLDLHPEDILVTSAWWDANAAGKLPLSRPFVYLIQDYEPIFYANGDRSTLAERTYHLANYIPVCNTRLMYEFMAQRGYRRIEQEGLWFEPAVSLASKQAPRTARGGKRRLLVYARPAVERNLCYLAISAVNRAFTSGQLVAGDWELFMAGQDSLPDIRLSSGGMLRNLGKMDLDRYAAFAGTVDLAISPMLAPHPNYPTLEFASLGAAVVTTRYETKKDLSRYSKNIFMAEPNEESLSDAIVEASRPSAAELAANARHNAIGGDWDAALSSVLPELASRLTRA